MSLLFLFIINSFFNFFNCFFDNVALMLFSPPPLRNIHENPNTNCKMNIIMTNIAHSLNIFLFYFMVDSDLILVTVSNVIVIVIF